MMFKKVTHEPANYVCLHWSNQSTSTMKVHGIIFFQNTYLQTIRVHVGLLKQQQSFTAIIKIIKSEISRMKNSKDSDTTVGLPSTMQPPAKQQAIKHKVQMLNLEDKSTPQSHCCAAQTIPEPVLLCGTVHYPAETGHSHQGVPFPRMGVHGLQQCLGRWYVSK